MPVKIIRKNPKWTNQFTKILEAKGENEIAVGFPKGQSQAYPDGTSVIDVATQHCFGLGVPQRDFMTYAKHSIQQRTDPILRQLTKEIHPAAIRALCEAAGLEGVVSIRDAILNGNWPPNSPATLHPIVGGTNPEGKKSTRPLIDTAHMINSVTYVVRKKTT